MIILVSLNLSSSEWSSAISEENIPEVTVRVGFTSDSMVTQFDGLRFGWSCSVNTRDFSAEYPRPGSQFLRTDQPYISDDVFACRPDESVVLSCWAANAGMDYAFSVPFVTPSLPSPFPSWVWSDEIGWDAPVPYPDDGGTYYWSEADASWVSV